MSDLRTFLAFGVVLAFVMLAVFAPLVAPRDPFKGGADALLAPGNQGFTLGSDHLGRDILSELIFGARVSLAVGISAISVAMLKLRPRPARRIFSEPRLTKSLVPGVKTWRSR